MAASRGRTRSGLTVAGGALVAVLALAPAYRGALAAPRSGASAESRRPDLPSAADIVAKSIAAGGGLAAWSNIRSMIWIGNIESAHAPVPSMRFVLSQERPNKTRFEVNAMGQTDIRVFDGRRGFKMRPARNGGLSVEPYDPQEVQFAQAARGIGGPLLDYADRGNPIALDGVDRIDGHKTYVIEVRLADGEVDHVWVDTTTYLERRLERTRFAPGGKSIAIIVLHRSLDWLLSREHAVTSRAIVGLRSHTLANFEQTTAKPRLDGVHRNVELIG